MQEQVRAALNRSNLLRLITSLVLALVLWGWVSTIEDPKREKNFTDVAVTEQHLADGLIVTTTIPNVQVHIDGPQSNINPVTADDIVPTVDFSDVTAPGQYTLPIELAPIDGLWHKRTTPGQVTVDVERETSKNFDLKTEISGDSGTSRSIGEVRAVTNSVTVTGPESEVAKVASVVLPITIENQTHDFVGSFTPEARDADGNPISDVTISPDSISATVPISSRGKSVTVIVQTAGQPADGYTITNKAANPQTVTVDGPQDVIDNMIAVNTRPVDVQGATSNVQQNVEIVDLPAGVTVIEPSSGEVAVQVNVTQEGSRQELAGQPVTYTGLGSGLGVEIQPSDISVVVDGSDAALSALKSGDVTVQVDLSGLGPGTYTLEPKVLLAQGLEWVSSSPPSVTVRIVSLSSSTPQPSGSPISVPAAVLPESSPTHSP